MGSLHHKVAVLVPDEKLLVLILAHFFFQKETRQLSSGTSTASLRMMAPHWKKIEGKSKSCKTLRKRKSSIRRLGKKPESFNKCLFEPSLDPSSFKTGFSAFPVFRRKSISLIEISIDAKMSKRAPKSFGKSEGIQHGKVTVDDLS